MSQVNCSTCGDAKGPWPCPDCSKPSTPAQRCAEELEALAPEEACEICGAEYGHRTGCRLYGKRIASIIDRYLTEAQAERDDSIRYGEWCRFRGKLGEILGAINMAHSAVTCIDSEIYDLQKVLDTKGPHGDQA